MRHSNEFKIQNYELNLANWQSCGSPKTTYLHVKFDYMRDSWKSQRRCGRGRSVQIQLYINIVLWTSQNDLKVPKAPQQVCCTKATVAQPKRCAWAFKEPSENTSFAETGPDWASCRNKAKPINDMIAERRKSYGDLRHETKTWTIPNMGRSKKAAKKQDGIEFWKNKKVNKTHNKSTSIKLATSMNLRTTLILGIP